jgi:hypothetical protein
MPGFKSTVSLCVLLLLTLIPRMSAIAQSEERKIEVGAQISALGEIPAQAGGGGRLTFDLTKGLALEGELNYFPGAGFNDVRRFQGQFGVKSGLRFDRFGLFGKARPGFIKKKWDFQRAFCVLPCPPGQACIAIVFPFCPAITVAETAFSVDVGGVAEFYPAKRVTVRFDAGDTIIKRLSTTHNLQLSAGVGFRF